MRFVLAGYGTRGDVQPFVALGVRLVADGHEVVVGASPTFADWVRGHGLEFHPVGGDVETLIRRHARTLTRKPTAFMQRLLEEVRAELDVAFDDLLAAARGAHMIVSGAHSAAPSVAEALGIPHRTIAFCPQLVPSREHPPVGVPWLSLPRAVNGALWGAMRVAFTAALGDEIQRRRRALGLGPAGDLLTHVLGRDTLVASDAALGALPKDAPAGVIQTGSLALATAGGLDPTLERFLSSGEPPVYIGFGSMADDDPERTTRSVVAALAHTRQRAVLVAGWAGLGGAALPPSIHLARSVPHDRLLPRVALAIHHGGAGTTAAAARAGVPQIVVPHIADQFYWGRQIHERGLGARPIARRDLNAARLSRAIAWTLASKGLSTRARATGEALRKSDGAATLAEILCRTAREVSPRAAA